METIKIYKANYRRKNTNPECSHNHASDTTPNESYSVRKLLDMHKQGLHPLVEKEALWEIDTFGEELNPLRIQNLDLTDIDDLRTTIEETKAKALEMQKNAEKQAKIKYKQQIIDEHEQSKTIIKEKTRSVGQSNNKE